MLKKTITYENFNDETVTEDHFFHLSKAELVEMEMSHDGGYSDHLERIVKSEDGKQIMDEFKNLIQKSYGKKSSDGKRFIKNDEIREEFLSSEAYSTIFMELVTDAEQAANFINGVIPKGLAAEVEKIAADPSKMSETTEDPLIGVWPAAKDNPPKPRVLTRDEAIKMPHDRLSHLLATGEAVLSDE